MYSLSLNKYTDSVEVPVMFYNDLVSVKELALADPMLTIETNKAGTLEFSMPSCNFGYNSIEQMKTEVTVHRDGTEVWRGRVLESGKDFYNQKKVTVEGELAYLNDTFQPQLEYRDKSLREFLDAVLTIHNNKVAIKDEELDDVWYKKDKEPFNKAFVIGIVDASIDPTLDIMYRNTNYECTYDVIKKVVEDYKLNVIIRREIVDGHIIRRLDFLKDFETVSDQRIAFGSNLLDFDQTFKMEKLCTVCLPVGAKIKDNDAGDELDTKDTFTETGRINCIGSDGVPYYVDESPYTVRKARFVKLSDYGIEPGDKIFYTTSVESDDAGVPGHEDVWRDGIYSFVKYLPGVGWSVEGNKAVSNSDREVPKIEAFKAEGVAVPENTEYFVVGGMVAEDTTDYKLRIFKQKKELEKLDEYFNIEQLRTITEESDDYEGVTHALGEPYVINPTLFDKYGWIEKKVEYGDVEKLDQLYVKVKEYMTTTQFEQMTLDITAYDLNMMGVNTNNIWINMKVPVFSAPHGLIEPSFSLPCTKLTLYFSSPERNEYTLGYSSDETITNNMNSMNNTIKSSIENLPGISETLASAKENVTQVLNAFAGTGVVQFIKDSNDDSIVREIHIYNNQDAATADGRWVFNYGGIGFQKKVNNIWQEVEVALTNQGEIVANKISSGEMYADLIYGGKLTLDDVTYKDTTTRGELRLRKTPQTPDPEADEHDYDILYANNEDGIVYQNITSHVYSQMLDGFILGGLSKDPIDPYEQAAWESYRTQFPEYPNKYFLGRIRWNASYEGDYPYGLELTSRMIVLNCEQLALSEGYNSGGYELAHNGRVGYVREIDSDGNPVYAYMNFHNGICTEVEDVNSEEE